MKKEDHSIAIQRLTALWALTESGLGGVMHAFKSPFTGLFVGGIAMIIICLIGYYSKNPWKSITKSLVVVLVVKMLVSPHSMISAYFAVSFQAILAASLFSLMGVRLIPILLLCTLGYVESALQKIISLTILYGKSIWEAIDTLGDYITSKFGYVFSLESSEALIIAYVSTYFIAGLFLGYFIYKLIDRIVHSTQLDDFSIIIEKDDFDFDQKKKKRKKLGRMIATILGLALLIILVLYLGGRESSGWTNATYILFRTILILVVWYAIIAPIIMRYVKRYLAAKKSVLSSEIDQVFGLIPYMKKIVSLSWNETKGLPFLERFRTFVFRSLMYCLYFKIPSS